METVNSFCEICKNPIFICKCDSTWNYFDKCLTDNCLGKSENGVAFSSLNISTMTICFNFNQFINLNLLKEKLPNGSNINYIPGLFKIFDEYLIFSFSLININFCIISSDVIALNLNNEHLDIIGSIILL